MIKSRDYFENKYDWDEKKYAREVENGIAYLDEILERIITLEKRIKWSLGLIILSILLSGYLIWKI